MIFVPATAYFLIVLIAIVLSGITILLMVRVWKIRNAVLFAGLLPGLLFAAAVKTASFQLLIVNKNDAIDYRFVLGHPVYQAADGQKIRIITRRNLDHYIINLTDEALAIEHLQYASSDATLFPFALHPTIIPPHRSCTVGNFPDFLPNDTAPNEVQVVQGVKKDWREWLRRASAEESEAVNENELVPVTY